MKRIQTFIFLVLVTTVFGSTALAQGAGAPPGTPPKPPPPVTVDMGRQEDSPADFTIPDRHDDKEGLFLRFQLGFAMNWDWETYNGASENYSGPGFGYGFSLGGFVAPNLALGAELSSSFIPSPQLTVDDVDMGTDTDIVLTNVYFTVNYYFQPINLFVVGGAGLGGESETGWGPALKLGVGKEWDIGHGWGIGFLLQGEYANLPNGSDSDGHVRFNAFTPSLLLTVSKG